MKRASGILISTVVLTAAIARAQPVPDVPLGPGPGSDGSDAGSGSDARPAGDPGTGSGSGSGSAGERPADFGDPYAPKPPLPPRPKQALPPLYMPEVLTTPTGFLLPAAVLYSKSSIDTGGGVTSDTRVGLGDVAEFGVATTDQVRERADESDTRADRIQPYLTASFRLGVAESRLFPAQPGMTLGFRKSFERNHDGFKTRVAELTLVASKHLGKHAAIHVGGAFWDASLEGDFDADGVRTEVTMHGFDDVKRQLRPFGGLEVQPLPRSQILIDIGWAPEFCYGCESNHRIRLKPVLSWGVRYEVARWMRLESGVRVPDIASANLLDAQIFGQVTFTSWALRRGIDNLK
jgi:hypothetical protein